MPDPKPTEAAPVILLDPGERPAPYPRGLRGLYLRAVVWGITRLAGGDRHQEE